MSLDFGLRVPSKCHYCDGDTTTLEFDINITHNLSVMAKSVGLYEVLWSPKEHGFERAKDILEIVEDGLSKLKSSPNECIVYNPPNGWGSYAGFVEAVAKIADACRKYPDAEISVWA